MKQFFVNTTFPIWLRSENAIRKLSTLAEVCFPRIPFFLSKSIEILGNLNPYHICKGERKKLQKFKDIKSLNT